MDRYQREALSRRKFLDTLMKGAAAMASGLAKEIPAKAAALAKSTGRGRQFFSFKDSFTLLKSVAAGDIPQGALKIPQGFVIIPRGRRLMSHDIYFDAGYVGANKMLLAQQAREKVWAKLKAKAEKEGLDFQTMLDNYDDSPVTRALDNVCDRLNNLFDVATNDAAVAFLESPVAMEEYFLANIKRLKSLRHGTPEQRAVWDSIRTPLHNATCGIQFIKDPVRREKLYKAADDVLKLAQAAVLPRQKKPDKQKDYERFFSDDPVDYSRFDYAGGSEDAAYAKYQESSNAKRIIQAVCKNNP